MQYHHLHLKLIIILQDRGRAVTGTMQYHHLHLILITLHDTGERRKLQSLTRTDSKRTNATSGDGGAAAHTSYERQQPLLQALPLRSVRCRLRIVDNSGRLHSW